MTISAEHKPSESTDLELPVVTSIKTSTEKELAGKASTTETSSTTQKTTRTISTSKVPATIISKTPTSLAENVTPSTSESQMSESNV